MEKFQYRIFRCRYGWGGGDYYLEAMAEKEWLNADELGKEGWEFCSFAPKSELFVKDSFDPEIAELIVMALFKRRTE